MKWAEAHGFGRIVTNLLTDQLHLSPKTETSLAFLLRWVNDRNFATLLMLLFSDKRMDPTLDPNVLCSACFNEHLEVVQFLLADKRIDPSQDNQAPIRFACQNGHLEIVKLLLADERVDPSANEHHCIRRASEHGHTAVVRLLLADQRVDPSAKKQYSIRCASQNGHVEVVKLLLADSRVDPSASEQHAIRTASEQGQTEVVKLLLADPRVDPSAKNQDCIRQACYRGHMPVAKLLLTDKRVDPSIGNQLLIQTANRENNIELVQWLLADQRVSCLVLLNPSSLEILALCSLRCSYRHEMHQQNLETTFSLFGWNSFLAEIEKIEAQRKAWLDDCLLVSDLSALCLSYVPDLFCHFNGNISSLVDANSNNNFKFPRFSLHDLSTL
jgi:ankyrin repeat protein